MPVPRPLIAGNWKMHGLASSLAEARAVAEGLGDTPARVAICPPSILIHRMAEVLAGTPVIVGGQDAHSDDSGAFTGDVSAEMLADAGAKLVILGHSERRAGYRETDALVAAKVRAALRAGLEPIVCVGEVKRQANLADAIEVVTRELAASAPPELKGRPFAVGYEPTWAVGTGLTPTRDEIAAVHAALRRTLRETFGAQADETPILYGGSVKPANAAEILHIEGVDGALVGGASLKAEEFLAIIRAVSAAP
jgi:triosephosphate isomerase